MLKGVPGGPSRALGKRSEESRSSALQTREQIYLSGFGQPEPDHHKARLELQGQRLGEGMGSECLKETEFQSEEMRKFWRWIVGMVAQQCEWT